jgi:hypothetical protein
MNMSDKSVGVGKIAVITVHGTGDSAKSVAGEKWWQQGSNFTERLKSRLKTHGLDADIYPLIWSGANSASAREAGGDELADTIKQLNKNYGGVHLVGHSHGGNVINVALDLLRWGQRKKSGKRVASAVTVGTPFFKMTTGWGGALFGVLFFWITVLSAIVFGLTILFWILGTVAPSQETAEVQANVRGAMALFTGDQWIVWVFIGMIVASTYFMIRLAIQGMRRIFRPRKPKPNATERIFAIWHRNDEAISFLQNVEKLPIEPFPKGALARGSRNKAINWGVRGVILSALAGFFTLDRMQTDGEDPVSMFFTITIFGLLLAPLVFSIAYLLYRGIVGFGLMELLARGRMNKFLEGTIKGIAFGKDGDQILGSVSVESHSLFTEQHVLSGDVEGRMQANSEKAADTLLRKYRWQLFTVGADTNASVSALSTDAMTWDSLIHTTYFDQPETSDLIGDYIAAQEKKKG